MNVVAFDTETKGFSWWDPNEQAFLATWADETGEWHADLSDPAETATFRAAIEAADVVVGHNLKFDCHMVRHTLGWDPLEGRRGDDTELMSRVAYPEGASKNGMGHGLKGLAKVYLRADADAPEENIKEMGKAIGLRTIKQTGAYFDVWRAYPEVMEEYARMDARYTFDLYEKFSAALEGRLADVYELDRQAALILDRAEERGVRVDQEKVAELKAQYTRELQDVHERLSAELGEAALGGAGSDAALLEALQMQGVPLYRKTDTGQLATNKFALQEFAKDYPVIADLFEHRLLSRFLSTYVGPLDGREIVHANFSPTGAWTGRMSCRQPNMQNFPKRAGKEVRSVFIPREGHAFVVSDYEAIEIRLLAYYLNDEAFRWMIAEGHDPHAWMATNIWGGQINDYVKGSPNEDKRKLAKNILFAITYGAGAPRVSDMLGDAGMPASRDEAKAIISKIKSSLPNYYRFNKRVRSKIEALGYVNTIMGRKQIVNRDKSYVGINAIIQGSAADVMKAGLIAVAKAVAPLDAHPLLVVHDEIVVEVPIERAAECQRRQDAALCAAYPLDPRLSVESSVVTTSYADG